MGELHVYNDRTGKWDKVGTLGLHGSTFEEDEEVWNQTYKFPEATFTSSWKIPIIGAAFGLDKQFVEIMWGDPKACRWGRSISMLHEGVRPSEVLTEPLGVPSWALDPSYLGDCDRPLDFPPIYLTPAEIRLWRNYISNKEN